MPVYWVHRHNAVGAFYIDFCHQGARACLTDTFHNIVHSCVGEGAQLCSDAIVNALALWGRQVNNDSEFSLLVFLLYYAKPADVRWWVELVRLKWSQ